MMSKLTKREMEILCLVARGYSNHEIARKLGINERTVRSHMSNILGTLHLRNRLECVIYALRRGWVRLHDIPIAELDGQAGVRFELVKSDMITPDYIVYRIVRDDPITNYQLQETAQP